MDKQTTTMKSQKNNQTTNLQLSSVEELPNFVIFKTSTGKVNVDVFFHDDTLWLTQKKIAELFEVQRPAITKHLGNIFTKGELIENSVSSILEHTAEDGKVYNTKYYNLRNATQLHATAMH